MADLEPTSLTGGGETVRCRYCGQLNRARTDGGQARCGRCRLLLSTEPHVKFADLDKHSYVHPLDSRSLAALRAIPGLDKAVTKLLNLTGEPFLNVIMMASAVRVTPLQCPDLYAKLQVACTTLGVDMPELYVMQSPIVNAFTYGVDRTLIVLFSGLLERLTDEEVLAVIAHEVGHIHAEHVLYLTAANLIMAIATGAIKASPISNLVTQIISAAMESALKAWMRRAELSCDRAALLVTQDPDIIGRTMMKLSGGTYASRLDYNQFLQQARDFRKQYDDKALDRFWADIVTAGLTHPFPIWRVSELLAWVESGEYAVVLNGGEAESAAA